MAGATFGGRVTTLHYQDVTSIELSTGLVSGVLAVHSPGFGATNIGDYWTSDKEKDPFKAPNAIPVSKAVAKQWQPYLEVIRERIRLARNPNPPPSNTTAQPNDLADQIERLARQREAGLLTDEEFSQAKKRLLDSF